MCTCDDKKKSRRNVVIKSSRKTFASFHVLYISKMKRNTASRTSVFMTKENFIRKDSASECKAENSSECV